MGPAILLSDSARVALFLVFANEAREPVDLTQSKYRELIDRGCLALYTHPRVSQDPSSHFVKLTKRGMRTIDHFYGE